MQPQEIIEMYNKGSRPSDIAFKANVRTRVIRKVLADAGIEVDPASLHKPSIWDLDEDRRRDAIIRRAASAARAARAQIAASQPVIAAPVPPPAPKPAPPPPPPPPVSQRLRILACVEIDVTKRTWRQIVQEVADKHRVCFNDILSPRRNKESVAARHEAAWRMRKETTMSLPQIGQRLGGKDHTTVLYAIKRHEANITGVPMKMRNTWVRPAAPTYWTDDKCQEALSLRDQGMTYREIWELVGGASEDAVRCAIARARNAPRVAA